MVSHVFLVPVKKIRRYNIFFLTNILWKLDDELDVLWELDDGKGGYLGGVAKIKGGFNLSILIYECSGKGKSCIND